MTTANPWLLAQSSLKYFMVKFLKLRWFSHYGDWETHVLNSPRSDHQAHRGSGKSIFWSFAVPLWDVIRGPIDGANPEDVLISYSEDQVRRLIRNIRIEVETNDFLKPLRPSTKELWGTDMLSFPNGYMISGVGFGTSSRGKHPRRIVTDDPLKDSGGISQEDQERIYFGVISGMAMAKTQMHVIGTPVEFGDLFEKLEKNEAYLHTKHPARKGDGTIQCPELFTEELLKMKKAEMGTINYARECYFNALIQRLRRLRDSMKRSIQKYPVVLIQSSQSAILLTPKIMVITPLLLPWDSLEETTPMSSKQKPSDAKIQERSSANSFAPSVPKSPKSSGSKKGKGTPSPIPSKKPGRD